MRSNHASRANVRTPFTVVDSNFYGFPTMQVLFEGVVEHNNVPQAFRGETGAQDSIIPSCDNFLELSQRYPTNELTDYLRDLRFYRPQDHRAYLEWIESSAKASSVATTAQLSSEGALALLRNLNQVQVVRNMHWQMTKKYIIERTDHPVATGGTPITTWLPNNWLATLEYMCDVQMHVNVSTLSAEKQAEYARISDGLTSTMRKLTAEVNEIQEKIETSDQKIDQFLQRSKVKD
jgi:indoleamine 2,3-dioxygenase